MADNLSPFEEPDDQGAAQEDERAGADERARADERAFADERTHEDARWREDARRRDRVRSNPGPLIGGAILILLGIVFLLDNMGIDAPFLDNWWAFFILIPAVSSLGRAWSEVQHQGRLSGAGTGALVWGLVLTLVAFTFLFGLTWSLMLPVLLILAGLSILITAVAVNR